MSPELLVGILSAALQGMTLFILADFRARISALEGVYILPQHRSQK